MLSVNEPVDGAGQHTPPASASSHAVQFEPSRSGSNLSGRRIISRPARLDEDLLGRGQPYPR
jgi:hypothetical protein